MSEFTDHLWRDLVTEHGATLAHAERPHGRRAGGAGLLRRPRVLAGSTLGLAGVGAAVVLGLSATDTPPAYAVTRHQDGSVSVKVNRRSGISGANHKLAAMGIHARVTAVGDGQSFQLSCVAPGPGPDGKSLTIKGEPKVATGPVSAGSTTSGKAGARATGAGAADSGGPAVGSTWHVVSCSSIKDTGASDAG